MRWGETETDAQRREKWRGPIVRGFLRVCVSPRPRVLLLLTDS